MSEASRKAAYRHVAELLGRVAHPPELAAELERIRLAMELAGDVPPPVADSRPSSTPATSTEVHAGK